MIDKVFEWLFAMILVLAILPFLVSIVIHTLGPVFITMAVLALIIGAYRSFERTNNRSGKNRSSGAVERKPIFPRGDD